MRKLRRGQHGQVLFEYVLMVAMVTIFALTLVVYFNYFSSKGRQMIRMVAKDVP